MSQLNLKTDSGAIVGEQGMLEGAAVRERGSALVAWTRRGRTYWSGRAAPSRCPRCSDSATRAARPVVTHGGLTGLVNGADASARDIVLSLESMNAIERIDVAGRTLRAQAGVKLGRVQRAAEEHGMVFPLDLGARDSATVGGNISTNAGGLRVLRYGMMRNLVLGIEAVLADGTVLTSLNRMLKNNAGYDLKQLFIGSEGTLGVVTRAELRLVSRTRSQETMLASLPSFDAMVELLGRLDSGLAASSPPSKRCGATTTTTTRRRRRRTARRWHAARRSTPSPNRWAAIRSTTARGSRACSAKRSRTACSPMSPSRIRRPSGARSGRSARMSGR